MSDIEYVMVMHDGNRSTKFMSEDYCKDLMEQLAFAQSPEVCTVAHDNVETCGYCQRDALAARLAALQSAAWDVCDVVQDALDTPEDADMKRIQAALDAMGELIPAQRPTVRESDDAR